MFLLLQSSWFKIMGPRVSVCRVCLSVRDLLTYWDLPCLAWTQLEGLEAIFD